MRDGACALSGKTPSGRTVPFTGWSSQACAPLALMLAPPEQALSSKVTDRKSKIRLQ
jgi:hypothetical protein